MRPPRTAELTQPEPQEKRPYRRRLGAVLFADVVGYTRLMGEDELATYSALERCLEWLEAECRKHDGEIIEVRGDGILAFFEKATNAVTFAVEMQEELERDNEKLPEERKLRFRVGINLGEVLRDHRGIRGDSVNLAARLQSIARPGRVFISASAYEQVRDKLRYGYEYLGTRKLKNVREDIGVYCVRSEIESALAAPSLRSHAGTPASGRPDVPSVAILPFETAGGEQPDDWFADGITDDIIRSISKFRNLFVISRSSAFLYKANAVRPQDAAHELGVRYVTTGSIRRAGSRIRVSVELTDADTDRTVWAERYDREVDDIFAVQDDITQTIVVATAAQIEANEAQRMRHIAPSSLAAYGYVLRGQHHVFQYTRRDNRKARLLYERARETDRRYARASAALSRTLNIDWRYSWSNDPETNLDRALAYAREAVNLDPTDARGYAELGFAHLWRREHEASLNAYQRALTLNPNDADVMCDYADALVFSGQSEEAVATLARAMRLNPFYPDDYLWNLAGAYYDLRDYDKAIETVLKMNNPTEGQRVLAASYAQIGKVDLARKIAAQHKAAHPNFSLDRWSRVVPDRIDSFAEHFYEGLKKAGF